jgi:hypothetical protein
MNPNLQKSVCVCISASEDRSGRRTMKIPSGEFNNVYSLQKLKVIKIRKMKYVGYVARIGDMRKRVQNFSPEA